MYTEYKYYKRYVIAYEVQDACIWFSKIPLYAVLSVGRVEFKKA